MNAGHKTNAREKTMTVYGQNVVREALEDKEIDCQKLHISEAREYKPKVKLLIKLAELRDLPIRIHPKGSLARISKNARQDQGVALDILFPKFETVKSHLSKVDKTSNIIAIDHITNPKNVGIILRSAVAAGISGLVYPRRNSPRLGPLVIQSSAGAALKAPIIWCDNLTDALIDYKNHGFSIIGLDPSSSDSLLDMTPIKKAIFILGAESSGISTESSSYLTKKVSIPMSNLVESLNVAVAGSLLSYFIKYDLERKLKL